jgi:gliding-associated putative ABC transporter substrate-binding component GldG
MIRARKKYEWLYVLGFIILINWLAGTWHGRFDLTAEKRYTLSGPTKRMLKNLRDPVTIEVFLEGEMPAGFKKLANSTKDMLQNFKELGTGNIRFNFRRPLEGLNDTARAELMDSLQRLGLSPMNVKAQAKEGLGNEERLLYPGALISSNGKVTAVDFLQGQSAENGINSLNNAEALLEYKLASGIHKVTQEPVPVVGYLLGNGEPFTYNVYDLIEHNIRRNYGFSFVPIDSFRTIPSVFNALLVVKPTKKFSEDQKLKIDQFIMRGGKLIWVIDNLFAEMDSLQRSKNEFIAFDRGLNLEDQLFKYGVRINLDLVQDANCDKIPSIIGQVGGKPQIELLPWPYFPLLSAYSTHPIVKNLDYVLSEFPNSIDTVKALGIKKTFLLSSSDATKILQTPARVAWNFIQTKEEASSFTHPPAGVAVLLEGKFNSPFKNRISKAQLDTLDFAKLPFQDQCQANNKMIVISNAEIVMNAVSEKEGPLPMGMNPYTRYKYANSEFIMNGLEYLVDSSGIMEARAKDFTLRLLDKKKLEESKSTWQLLNIALPIALILLFGFIYQLIRNRRFQHR